MKPTLLAFAGIAAVGLSLAARAHLHAAALRRTVAELEHATTHDRLTGLHNRAGLEQAWNSPASARPVVAVLDLDGFKPVNDRHGHAAGDVVLATVAARLARTIPGTVARLGGDEFAALLPAGVDAEQLAHRVAAAVAEPIPLPGAARVTVTTSIGLSRPGSRRLGEALGQADAAMYRAKTTRTTVARFDPHRDDRSSTTADPRPVLRVRDLPRVNAGREVPAPC